MFPTTAAVVVERPPKERVSPVRMTGQVAERLVSSEMSRPATSAVPTVAQVAAPSASKERINWLVQEAPVYSAVNPPEPVRMRAEVRDEKVGAAAKVEVSVEVELLVIRVAQHQMKIQELILLYKGFLLCQVMVVQD